MLRANSRGINKNKKVGKKCSYEKMMKTLLLQNQQIIIQQQNMMFMVMRQYQHQQPAGSPSPQQHQHHPQQATTHATPTIANIQGNQEQSHHHHHQQQQQHNQQHHQHNQHHQQHHDNQHKFHQIHPQEQQHSTSANSQQQNTSSQPQQQHQPLQIQHQQSQQHQQQMIQHHHQTNGGHPIQQQFTVSHHQATAPHTPVTTTTSNVTGQSMVDTQHQLQQVVQHLNDNLGGYMTPAASEQDPISDNKPGDEDLHALLESDGLLDNNLLYNPEADTGSITPYKNHQQQQQTPSYYSSGCESLTTPRVEQPRQPTTTNISQNVVKNLADSFKSPTKPKNLNINILSGSETRNLKNSKAKIIQTMNISEFLRQVHHDDGQKGTSH